MMSPLRLDLSKVPSFPQMATRVLALVSKPDAQIPAVVALIQKDPIFGAEILRLANSAAFATHEPITSLTVAISRVGFVRLRSLTITVALRSVMNSALKRPAVRRCWTHSLASALIAKRYSKPAGIEENEAYSLGLLHDIGRLGLLTIFSDEYGNLLSHSYDTKRHLLAAEEFLFGEDHCCTGRALATRWNLSETLREIAGSHHETPTERTSSASRLVYIACGLADCLSFDCNTEAEVAPGRPRLRALSENTGFAGALSGRDLVARRTPVESLLDSATAEIADAVRRDLSDLKETLMREIASLQLF